MSTDASWLEDMPKVYDRDLGPALFEPYARHLAGLAQQLAPARVLELAAGTGIVTRFLREALPDAEVVATDLNDAMVAWAAERVPGVTWEQADAQHLTAADGSFDLVVSQFGAMFFPDRVAAYAETARVLAPGGTLLMAVWDVVEGSPLVAAFVDCLESLFPDDPPCFLLRVPHGYADPDQIRADLNAGGLQVKSLERVVLTGRVESARALVRGFAYGSPLRFDLQAHGSLESLVDRLGDALKERVGDGPLPCEVAAFVAQATPAASESRGP
jgi:SAM-dependent methyltransferase